ncbi:Hypothetical protein I595_2530 [Croceitalea dokdonensis DOKDO 023]|uniref:Uncharacterized protein n=1 Tax=Croceitalea dokdonensis DOKDO 023 TaxID=1300341 RepID=A0A0P7AHD6_9FLAO|nr:Hypothetical protein I595_2530 [Croceitalea dokdonensis DOKDO 023]
MLNKVLNQVFVSSSLLSSFSLLPFMESLTMFAMRYGNISCVKEPKS